MGLSLIAQLLVLSRTFRVSINLEIEMAICHEDPHHVFPRCGCGSDDGRPVLSSIERLEDQALRLAFSSPRKVKPCTISVGLPNFGICGNVGEEEISPPLL